MIEKNFVKQGILEAQLEEYLRKKFEKAGYSWSDLQRTPLGLRIIVFAHKPGLVVGRSGKKIQQIAEEISKKFGVDNPLLDVREIENPYLDAEIVARRIAKALERGINYKKVCNFYLSKVMEQGAVGVRIRVGGKLAGKERSRFQKFKEGFLIHSGEYSNVLVQEGYAQASIKPGIVGVHVKIMKKTPKEFEFEKKREA